jgi:acyl-CoA synthetase (AMP-forming)/AMP-acid ligase II
MPMAEATPVLELSGPPLQLVDATLPSVLDAVDGGVAVVAGETETSYEELKAESRAVAARLLAAGIRPGARVALLAGNGTGFIAAQYGIFHAGAICLPLNTRLAPPELQAILAHSEADTLIFEERIGRVSQRETIEAIGGSLPSLHRVLPLDDVSGGVPEPVALPRLDPGDPALLIYTSGTTGKPKGVLHAHRTLVNSARVTAGLKRLNAADRILASVPMFNAFGSLNCVLEAFTVGAAIVVERAFEAGEALRLIEAHRVSVFLGTPTMWLRLLEHPDFAAAKVATLRTGMMAGAPPPPGLARRWRDLGCAVNQIYGLTEATSILSDGRPTPGMTVALMADGELLVRGFNRMLGYFRDPDATAARINDGWLHTGDLAKREGDGALRVIGRSDDMIIVGGFNVQPAEVEEALRGHAGVLDAAAFGVPDRDLGQVVAAWVVARPGAAIDVAGVDAHCRNRLAGYKRPVHLRVVDELPLTANGKVQRYRMREALERELRKTP